MRPMLLSRLRTSPGPQRRADAAGPPATSMPSFSRIATAVVIVCLAIGQAGSASAAGDPCSRRREVESQRAQAAARLNVLKASQTQIQKALDDLDNNVRSQSAAVASA